MAVKMIDMARTPAEKKAMEKAWASPANPGADEYPYGLCINIDGAGMDKLGLEDLPEVGSTVDIVAKGKITSCRMEVSEGRDDRSISIQITEMGVDEEEEKDEPASEKKAERTMASAMYGKDDDGA